MDNRYVPVSTSRARGQASRVAFSSNLRQVGQAFISYATDHNGSFPAAAGVEFPFSEDWVHWQPGRNIRQSRLLRYLGNNVTVLSCPSAPKDRATAPPYIYS